MPELPDVVVYLEALERRLIGETLTAIRVVSPFVLRTFDPPMEAAVGRKALALRRLGKRIAIGLEGDLWLVIHLMIAGRFLWKSRGAKPPGKIAQAIFEWTSGTLILTEAGTKRRASLHVLQGASAVDAHDPGGLEVLDAPLDEFAARLTDGNHTLKRVLADPRRFSGIGNAYSDEILHRAKLSPVMLTSRLKKEEIARLHAAVQSVLSEWIERLRDQARDAFPEKVTAFRPEMAVHGRFGQPCPVCGTEVQRIRYAENETNYCPRCQTGGKLLADRSLSRLLKNDWPKTIDDWE
ncbi:MAG: formamidopyrimidine-DNA glycosylase [Planctomycetaceae bacterium]|nr:formamidopyrimidine-DNA glycosylase [Planctomycetaceae bacterium]